MTTKIRLFVDAPVVHQLTLEYYDEEKEEWRRMGYDDRFTETITITGDAASRFNQPEDVCELCRGEGFIGDHWPCPACTAPALWKAQLDAVYKERNLLAQLVGRLALELRGDVPGFDAWFGSDPDEPDWPVLYVETPAGQISYHMPEDETVLDIPAPTVTPSGYCRECQQVGHHVPSCSQYGRKWDGHTKEDVEVRIRKLLSKPAPGLVGDHLTLEDEENGLDKMFKKWRKDKLVKQAFNNGLPERGDLYTLRLYDRSDGWMDISPEPEKPTDAFLRWLHETEDGTKYTKYEDGAYYSIFPDDTEMLYRTGGG